MKASLTYLDEDNNVPVPLPKSMKVLERLLIMLWCLEDCADVDDADDEVVIDSIAKKLCSKISP